MNRQQLAKILRSASQIADDPHVLVLGSQSILGTYDEDDLPRAATASMEADIAFMDDDDRSKADLVEGAIGELSPFHEANGFYPEGVHIDTAILPSGWQDRTRTWNLTSSHPAKAQFLDAHDLAASKLVAFREKDREFVAALLDAGQLDGAELSSRLRLLPGSAAAQRDQALVWLDGLSRGD